MNLSLQSTNASNPFANLNLSSTQQSQIQSILNGAQSQDESFSQVQTQIQSVLSPTQQKTLQSDLTQLKDHHSGHHHGHHGGGGSSATTDVLSPGYEQAAAVQNQVLAAQSISQSQLQDTLLQFGTAQS